MFIAASLDGILHMKTMLPLLLILLWTTGSPDDPTRLDADSLQWQSLPQALEDAAGKQQPILIYVHAPWCGPCLRDLFPEVAPLLERFALARLDLGNHDPLIEVAGLTQSPAAWARHFGADTTPAFVFLAPDGTIITRVTGFQDVQGFSLLLAYVATGAYRHATLESYAQSTNQ